MAKNILTISLLEFKKEVWKLSFGTLKNLIEGIREIKRSRVMSNEEMYDLERKETAIWKVLQYRGKLNKNTNGEFNEWQKKLGKKRQW